MNVFEVFEALGLRDSDGSRAADASDMHTCLQGRVGYGKHPAIVQRMGRAGGNGEIFIRRTEFG